MDRRYNKSNPAYPGWLKGSGGKRALLCYIWRFFLGEWLHHKAEEFVVCEGQHLHFTMEALEFRLAELLDVSTIPPDAERRG